jgi:hypothetical protein
VTCCSGLPPTRCSCLITLLRALWIGCITLLITPVNIWKLPVWVLRHAVAPGHITITIISWIGCRVRNHSPDYFERNVLFYVDELFLRPLTQVGNRSLLPCPNTLQFHKHIRLGFRELAFIYIVILPEPTRSANFLHQPPGYWISLGALDKFAWTSCEVENLGAPEVMNHASREANADHEASVGMGDLSTASTPL